MYKEQNMGNKNEMFLTHIIYNDICGGTIKKDKLQTFNLY